VSVLALILILAPVLIFAVCLGEKTGIIVLPPALRAASIFVLLIALMLTGIPVSIALGLTVLTFLFTLTAVPIEAVSMKLFTGIESFEIMAIPFFILAGNFLTHGGVARRMINFATSLIGHWHGGLGLAGIVACSMFALVCGSSVATVAAIGAIVLPEMVRNGYPMRFGAGIITVAGSLGILMLPSIPKIIYAISTNTSIGALFVAGLLPGILLTTMLCVVTWYLARRRDYPRMPKSNWTETWHAFRESIWGLMLVVIIIGGIYSGLFTATEAAAMAAVYSFFIAVFVYKALAFKDVPRVLLRAANTSAMLLYIVTNAVLFSFVLSNENIPSALANWITAQNLGWVGFLLLVNVLLLGARIGAMIRMIDGSEAARYRSGAFRHRDRRQYGSRPLSPAGRPQPLRRLDDRRHADHRPRRGGIAVASDHAGVFGNRDVLARADAVVAPRARDALRFGSVFERSGYRFA